MRVLALLISGVAALAPVTFQGPGTTPACKDMQCAPIECIEDFKWTNAEDAGTCCPICISDTIEVPGAEPVLPVGASLHPNAPATCHTPTKAFCPPHQCGAMQKEHYEEGTCCKVCVPK